MLLNEKTGEKKRILIPLSFNSEIVSFLKEEEP